MPSSLQVIVVLVGAKPPTLSTTSRSKLTLVVTPAVIDCVVSLDAIVVAGVAYRKSRLSRTCWFQKLALMVWPSETVLGVVQATLVSIAFGG